MLRICEKLWGSWVGLSVWVSQVGLIRGFGISMPNSLHMPFWTKTRCVNKTLSHMWGKLNFPMFLFNVGLLTLINIDSLIFLAKACPSLPIIWKLFWLVGWHVWLLWWWMGEGSLRCSLNLSPKVLEVSPMYSLSQVRSPHWNQYTAPFCWPWGLYPWGRPVGAWLYDHLWSGSVCHTSHRSSWYIHRDPVCKI